MTEPRDYPSDDWLKAASPLQRCAICGESVYQCECQSQSGACERVLGVDFGRT